MLYTGQGDDGTTLICDGGGSRVSKRSKAIEALGSVDEVNSWLGLCKARLPLEVKSLRQVVHSMQENLFIVQAELAGADKTITPQKVTEIEELTDKIEQELPEIKSFFIAGETEISAVFDVARALVRRAERDVIDAAESGEVAVSQNTRAYLNRLSSVLYALVRWTNIKLGATEKPPTYK